MATNVNSDALLTLMCPQMISTMIHALFGYTLMGVGATRIIEVCFLLKDQPTGQGEPGERSVHWYSIQAFQYLCVCWLTEKCASRLLSLSPHSPIWLLFSSGVLFMSATDEELRWADGNGASRFGLGWPLFSLLT